MTEYLLCDGVFAVVVAVLHFSGVIRVECPWSVWLADAVEDL